MAFSRSGSRHAALRSRTRWYDPMVWSFARIVDCCTSGGSIEFSLGTHFRDSQTKHVELVRPSKSHPTACQLHVLDYLLQTVDFFHTRLPS